MTSTFAMALCTACVQNEPRTDDPIVNAKSQGHGSYYGAKKGVQRLCEVTVHLPMYSFPIGKPFLFLSPSTSSLGLAWLGLQMFTCMLDKQ